MQNSPDVTIWDTQESRIFLRGESRSTSVYTALSLETGPCVQSIMCIHLVQQVNWMELPQIHDSETCFVGPQRYSYFPFFERSHITQLVARTYVCQSCEFNSHCFRFSPARTGVVCSLRVQQSRLQGTRWCRGRDNPTKAAPGFYRNMTPYIESMQVRYGVAINVIVVVTIAVDVAVTVKRERLTLAGLSNLISIKE